MSRGTLWIVSRAEDSHPAIVTLGYPTSASDLFRVVGIHRTGHEGINSCFIDVRTSVGLARLVEGRISSMEDIEAAENGLQALMWHDRIDVIVPGFKYRRRPLVSYARCEETRSDLAFDLLKPCDPYDVIYATEEVVLEDHRIVASSYPESAIVGLDFGTAMKDYLSLTPMQAAAIFATPQSMSAPAYFSDPLLGRFAGKRGFFGEFYAAIRRDWDQSTSTVPDIDFSVTLPPLTAIVLDRAASRDAIPAAIMEVRDELAAVRQEMLQLSDRLRFRPLDQRQVEEQCRALRESFQAVVRASRTQHRPIILTLLQLFSAVRKPLDLVMTHLNPAYSPGDPRVLANRTVTGRMFARLLATDSLHSLMTHFFTHAELRAIEASLRVTPVG
jgi:hypothetical protein